MIEPLLVPRAAAPAPSRLLPRWTVTIVRVFLVAQGVMAAAVGQFAPVLVVPGMYCGRESFCELNYAGLAVLEIPITAFAVLAIVAGAWWLRRDRMRGVVAFGVAAASLAGSAWSVATIKLTVTSAQSVAGYQFLAAWPLVIWPAIVVIVTLLLAMVSGAVGSRVISIAWPVACALVSLFLLTYLLPATDVRVAGLHWMGVVRVPANAPIVDSTGRTVSTDQVILVNAGHAYTYIVTISPGDYSVVETCTPAQDARGNPILDAFGNPMQPRERTIRIHVDPGTLTVVPNGCPFG